MMKILPARIAILVSVCLCLTLTACSGGGTATRVSAKTERRIGPTDVDALEINDTARFLAGMEGRADGPYHALEQMPAWQTYRANFNESWARVQESQFKPVADFEQRALKGDKQTSRFLFYPFSGPDVLYMTGFFPGRDVYVMAGLEGIGHLPRVGEYTAENAPQHLNAWSTAMNSIFRRSFFVTSEMSKQLHGDSDGSLPIIVLLLTRAGYTLDALQLGQLASDGTWEKFQQTPTARRARAVRVEFHKGGSQDTDTPGQVLYYFSTDLAKGFAAQSPFVAFLEKQGQPETFMKSASFLPHMREFTDIRNWITRASTRITQDDTGIPYQFLLDHNWNVRLYGEYSHPDKSFRRRFQPELEAAFADTGRVEPLGFSIGYGFHRRPSSLLVATPK
jgi:hypothetical protein